MRLHQRRGGDYAGANGGPGRSPLGISLEGIQAHHQQKSFYREALPEKSLALEYCHVQIQKGKGGDHQTSCSPRSSPKKIPAAKCDSRQHQYPDSHAGV